MQISKSNCYKSPLSELSDWYTLVLTMTLSGQKHQYNFS